jgi:hypothetical protein
MKNILKFFGFALVAILLFNSCEDNYTEEDAMRAQQVVDLIISVTDESNFDVAVDSATVKTVIDGVAMEQSTDASGVVIFEDVKIGGNLNVYVSKNNYTTTFTTVNTTPSTYRQTTVSANISIYSLADDNIATVKGQISIETDLTNRTKEVVEGMEVRAFNYSLPNGAVKAFIGTTDATGTYEIKVPVNSDGNDDIDIEYKPSYDAMRTAGISENYMYSVVTQPAIYEPNNYNQTYIPAIPSAVISIEAPGAGGSGFELTTEVDTTSGELTEAIGDWWDTDDITILNSGSGYFSGITGSDTTLWVPFSPDTKGLDTAHVELTFEKDGGLVSIDGLKNYGVWDGRHAQYMSKPTIDLNIGGGSGAQLYYDFKLDYYVTISDNGTNYTSLPTVKMTYVVEGVENIMTYSLGSYAFISDGGIYANSGDGILSQQLNYDEAPTFTIVNDESKSAFAYFTTGDITSDSLLTDSESWLSTGANYDPSNPPAVTITALAGYGTNGEFVAEITTAGKLNTIELVNAGSGYVKNINDFENDGDLGHSGDDGYITDDYFNNVLPGDVLISNAYYGTGMVTEL